MMDSISAPYPQCIQLLIDNITLDPYFKEFLEYARSVNIPVVVLSGGMEPIIEALLDALIGKDLADYIQIVGNGVQARPGKTLDDENGWEIKFHDDSGFGHDKSLTIRPYANLPADKRPTMFYAGDGVSDLSAAEETDLLFAKKGKDLVTYCVRKDVPFTLFEDWKSIIEKVREIVYVLPFTLLQIPCTNEVIERAQPTSKKLLPRATSSTSLRKVALVHWVFKVELLPADTRPQW
jgi:2,3-diketo-5-methylthio-1-phosphopentane phosphatase